MINKKLRDCECIIYEDLSINLEKEFAYQTVVQSVCNYDKDYFEKYVKMENTKIAQNLNIFRTKISQKYCNSVLDIGIGSGEFIKKSQIKAYGYDINPYGIKWLKDNNIFLDPYNDDLSQIDGLTFWDSLEHFYDPAELLNIIPNNKIVLISMPTFDQIINIKKSKHYRTNEHLSYFTIKGFIIFLQMLDFKVIEISTEETKSGRESITTFVAKKNN
jgi:SAM-dependent methyltransferase